ncbi:pentatricopeptide repeat-containing protein at1g80270 mitochondrial [Phtheirospermum japonicum]|uniref:Pentatricopeptide repeat-containing protein at1g80270 mitochondrial n=1 Tax=Phtheirospermum japonicum TaxID=374723 RepID=A0A830CKD5_9LAMI|nr:pentatricopeptide repeat-containing protein at1g80270 mitochondrial [Phtheirospermum japonicum]
MSNYEEKSCFHYRNRGLSSGSNRICCSKSDIARCLENHSAGIIEPQEKIFDGLLASARFFNTSSTSPKSHCAVRTFSSQTDAKSTKEDDDDLEDGFSELGTPAGAVISGDESDDGDISEEESIAADDIQNELEVFGDETASSEITRVILASPPVLVSKVLDKWVGEGNEVTQTEATITILHLRKRRMFGKALELSEWLESKECFEFVESNYASRVDLIAKVRGIYKAEEYIKKIPESLRGELVYRTLLANCVSATNVKKSEELFNKMKNLEFPVTCFSCNQLLLLYKRTDKRKIPDVLLLMEKENIKPSVFTYQILIDVKGQSRDITGMEQVVKTMEAEGLELNSQIKASLARYYAANGLKDKAESVLKEIEGDDIKKNRWACQWLIPIYASLGKEDEVQRIWKICEHDPRLLECMSAIDAWGQLNRIDNAESAFDTLLKKVKKPSSKHFTALLKVYASHKMLAKGKELVRRMGESGCALGPLTWDAIVRLYVGAGEVEKADSILTKAIKQKRGRPLFSTYLAIMEKYAARGDVHNAEKMLMMMRQSGYASRLNQYQTLLQAYVNANVPAYGFSERMKADNLFPNKALAGLLAKVDAFKKSPVSELLE